MSRPPRFRTAYSTTGEPPAGRDVLDYLPDEFADFVEMERALATSELGFPPSTAEGDFAGTLMELSALVAHVLGAYQDRYANDAFLGTARSLRSLVRHGRRLAYEPGPGLAATGYALITLKEGLAGTLPKGLAIGSAPVGEKKAQDYETLDEIPVDAAWGEMLPANALTPITFSSATKLRLEGTGLGIEPGEQIVVEKPGGAVSVHQVTSAPVEAGGRTEIAVSPGLVGAFPGAVVWAKPRHDAHLFGWDTSAATFTETALQGGTYAFSDASPPSAAQSPAVGYTVSPAYDANEIYLAEELKDSVAGAPGVLVSGAVASAIRVTKAISRNVTFRRVEHLDVKDGAGNIVATLYPTVSVTRAVTALLATKDGSALKRSALAIRSARLLLGFEVKAPLVTEEPNPATVVEPGTTPLPLDREIPGLVPGMLVALAERAAGGRFEIVRLASVSSVTGADSKGATAITWLPVEPRTPGAPWKVGNLRVLGNVVRLSHGKTVSEVLGDSDGSAPFLRFALRNKPLTYLPSANGADPELDVRVGGVLWTHVTDFESSSPEDRHYLVQRDETGVVTVVFGDGTKGAIPPSGKKHIDATYRIGIGPDGDAPAFAVSRLKRSHPLIERVTNPLAVSGGAAPAALEEVRVRATGYIRTFDRAVSVPDHKHLALLFPGVAKASAMWSPLPGGAEGVLVTVADANGGASIAGDVEAFLRARRDDTVPLAVQGPTLVDLAISLYMEIDPACLRDVVERAVREALSGGSESDPGLFTFGGRDLGQPAFLSQVYERVERVPGVRFVEVVLFDTLAESKKTPPPGAMDTLVAHAHELFVLAPQDIVFVPKEVP